MNGGRVLVFVVSALAPCSAAFGQSAELRAVSAWRLQFTYAIDSRLEAGGQQFEYRVTANGTGVLERPADNPTGLSFRGAPDMVVTVDYSGAAIDEQGCGLVERLTSSGPPSCELPTSLQLTSSGFEFELRCPRRPVVHTFEWQGACGELFPYPVDGDAIVDWPWLAQDVVFDSQNVRRVFPYPASGTVLAGRDEANLAGFLAPLFTAIAMGTPTPLDYRFDFTLTPATTEELTLELESAAYDRWRPSAAIPSGAGAPLAVTARVVSSTGRPPAVPVAQFVWQLEDTSSEPGVAMNFPLDAADDEPDLRFADADGAHLVEDRGQRSSLSSPEGFSDTVRIEPFDWGGWSKLTVTAVLVDGRRLVGKPRGASEPGMRIPKRSTTSLVADRWKSDRGVANRSDDADDEDRPAGDGTPGDGLTLYQEYRGFYVGDAHVTGDPRKKDLFVRNRAAGAATGGIARFTRHSGLAVHSELTEAQLSASRIVNGNRRAGPTVTSQHAVIIEVRAGQTGFAAAVGGPGNPKTISHVALMGDWNTLDGLYLSKIVAHELFHTVNVYHHGEIDEVVAWQDTMGTLTERRSLGPATPIRVLREDGVDVTDVILDHLQALPNKRRDVWLGVDHGQQSGFDNCVMRYNNASAYTSRADPGVRYYIGQQMGSALCATAEGTGPNAADWRPQSRFEDASPQRGVCVGQLLVTDAVTAPGR